MNPKSIRLDDADDPDRSATFARSLELTGANGNKVIRQLVDAYNRFVKKHGHGPAFPVQLAEPGTRDRSGKG